MTDKKDVFYFASLYGISCFFQPEENEVVGRNWFCKLLLDIQEFFRYSEFRIEIEHRTITREEIE